MNKYDLTSREREIINYLLDNLPSIQEEISTGHNIHYKSLPSSLPYIYEEHYKERAIQIISSNLPPQNPEEAAALEDLISKTLPELLTPKN